MDKKTRALTGPRQLKLMVPMYYNTFDTAAGGWPAMNGWKPTTGGLSIFYESYIDVNLALDDLTMFPQAAILQDPGVYYRTPSVPGDLANMFHVIDIVSTKRLNMDLVSNVARNSLPGMLDTEEDFNQIIMGTWRLMASNSTFGLEGNVQTTVDAKDFSSASPFAQDKLWCYRMLINVSSNLDATVIGAPASRFIIQVIVGKENDMPYMMRLKNSYELQQL